MVKYFGKFNYEKMYSKHPMVGSIATLAWEFWHIALTVGSMAVRMIKIMLYGVFYFRQVDTPVLVEKEIWDKSD